MSGSFETKKVKTETEVYGILADEMADCWWMFGEGKVNYVGKDLPEKQLYCSICSQLAFDNSLEEIFPEILKDYQFPNAARFLDRKLEKGCCLILLDGLDEVPDETDYETIVTLVNQFVARHDRVVGQQRVEYGVGVDEVGIRQPAPPVEHVDDRM